MQKVEYLHKLKTAKNMFNILIGAPCGKNFNYIIHKCKKKNLHTFKAESKL